MTALAQRLASLQKQAGISAKLPPATGADRGTPTHQAQVAQLRRLLGMRPRALTPFLSSDRRLEGEEIAPGLRYLEHWQTCSPPPEMLRLEALRHEDVAPEQILAFDTETTGLAGGTGTRAFMIGAGDWKEGRLRIRQLLMTRWRPKRPC